MKIAEEVLKFQNKKEAEREKLIEHIKQGILLLRKIFFVLFI